MVIQIVVILKYKKKNSADNSKLILFKLNYIILINLNKT